MDRKKAKKIAGQTADVTAGVLGVTLRTVLRVILTIVLVFICTGLLFACIFAYYVKSTLSSDLDITLEEASVKLSSSIWYYDASGQAQKLTTLSAQENRTWVDYNNIPKDMEHALVAIEDKRFYSHKGVDWYRTVGAFANMFLTMKNDFGGSTITQQLIKNYTQNDDVTVQRKLLEIFQALEFEKNYTKEEIVMWYLNIVYFGERSYGIQAAAQTYFGKDVWDLSLAECASIVGITNNPSKYDPFLAMTITDKETGDELSCREWNKRRQETILYEMYDQGYITYEQYVQAVNEELNFVRTEDETYEMEIYSYYAETVIDDVIADLVEKKNINADRARELLYSGGYQVYSCLDADIQAIVDGVYENLDALPKAYYPSQQQFQSAIVIMDPHTGEIVALSGGVGEKTINFGLNRATGAYRPAGSSIKPLAVYGPALEYGLITQTTLVNDAPYPEIQLAGTSWYPRNAGGGNSGIKTIRQALALSLNTVSAQILDKLTPIESYKFLTERLGFTSLVESDCDYAPLALGQFTNGVTVREMAQAYCSFTNEGTFTYSRTYTKVLDSEGNVVLSNEPQTQEAFSPNTAANVCSMLQNAVYSGTGSGAYFSGMSIGGKTGTTSDNKDRYFCGFTPYYTAAVWTGYDTPEKMYFNSNPAVVIWKSVMEQIHAGLENKNFPTPVIGLPTNIFGDLTEELEKQEHPEASPEVSEDPEETDEPATSPDTTTPGSTAPSTDVPSTHPTETMTPTTEPPTPSAPVGGEFIG